MQQRVLVRHHTMILLQIEYVVISYHILPACLYTPAPATSSFPEHRAKQATRLDIVPHVTNEFLERQYNLKLSTLLSGSVALPMVRQTPRTAGSKLMP